MASQLSLVAAKNPLPSLFNFPSTRYQGSKYKLLKWIWSNIKDLSFNTALDAFGGTGSVAYLFKRMGKEVTYNDILTSNYYVGLALIENSKSILTNADLEFILSKHRDIQYPTFIQDTFRNIYYLDHENRWLDIVVTNIRNLTNPYKKALAYYCLFQACIIKRPYNLFHRKNLYIRTAEVDRSFGNKTTWDTPFEEHFRSFAQEVNQYIFDNGRKCLALNPDVFEVPGRFDLVYIDPPYISSKGVGVDYFEFYHFLEGLMDYDTWKERIDYRSKHRRLKQLAKSPWVDKNKIADVFEKLFRAYQDSILVISYRSDGIPSQDDLFALLRKYKKKVMVRKLGYKYVLSTNGNSAELLYIAI